MISRRFLQEEGDCGGRHSPPVCCTCAGMRYRELIIHTKKETAEPLTAALIGAGFGSMQIDDPQDARDILDDPELYKYDYLNEEIEDFAAKSTDEIAVTLYFADDEEGRAELSRAEKLLASLKDFGPDDRLRWETSVTGDDSEWLFKWQEHFRPAKIGSRIVVKPGWEEYESGAGELVIEMDPGMAFGSGLHETTSMCIKALEKALAGEYKYSGPHRSSDETADASAADGIKVLDVGTGTGILAMASVLLGAEHSLGIDIDEEAVRVAGENIKRNGLEERIDIRRGDLMEGVEYGADIIVANLMADLVMKLAPAACSLLKKGGLFISSGILDIKENTVSRAIEDAGFEIIEVLADGEWRAVCAVRS